MVADPECSFNGAILMYSSYSYNWGFYCCEAYTDFGENENWSHFILILGISSNCVNGPFACETHKMKLTNFNFNNKMLKM